MCAIIIIVKERKRGKEKNDSNRIELERNGKEFIKCLLDKLRKMWYNIRVVKRMTADKVVKTEKWNFLWKT